MASSNLTLDQQRAAEALTQVRLIKAMARDKQGHYRTYVQALPAQIIMEGLGQALATQLAASNDKGHRLLYQQMENWLCRDDVLAAYPGQADVIEAIVKHDANAYRRAQAEAMRYLAWLKKFAVAFLEKPEGDG